MHPTRVPDLRGLAAGAGALAALYLLTGSGLVTVTEGQPPGAVPPLLIAVKVLQIGMFAAFIRLALRAGAATDRSLS